MALRNPSDRQRQAVDQLMAAAASHASSSADPAHAHAGRHGRWLVLYALGFVASGIVMPIPGPNLIAYYFAFLLVGHFLSRRGARHALRSVTWNLEPNEALVDLRRVAVLEPCERAPRIREIAGRLGLENLASFFERVTVTAP